MTEAMSQRWGRLWLPSAIVLIVLCQAAVVFLPVERERLGNQRQDENFTASLELYRRSLPI